MDSALPIPPVALILLVIASVALWALACFDAAQS
jgi:hypothetical protein